MTMTVSWLTNYLRSLFVCFAVLLRKHLTINLRLSLAAQMENLDVPLVRFGVLTDTQYADCDSKPAWWNPHLTRYYRTALDQIERAFDHWTRQGNVSFALQLGDIIDGVNRNTADPSVALHAVLAQFERYPDIPTFHTVGNHELYNFNRRDLAKHFYDYLRRMKLSEMLGDLGNNPLLQSGSNETRPSGPETSGASISTNSTNSSNEMCVNTLNDISEETLNADERTNDIPAFITALESKHRLSRLADKELVLPKSRHTEEYLTTGNTKDISERHLKAHKSSNTSRKKEAAPNFAVKYKNRATNDESGFAEDGISRETLIHGDMQVEQKFLQQLDESPPLYYAFRPADGVKLISLDCFEVAVIGYSKCDPRYKEASEILYEHHGHHDFDGWDCADLLESSSKRFQQMNGAVSDEQLKWLDEELSESDSLEEKVVVFGHVCLHPNSADWDCMLWNYESVLDVFHAHKCVCLYLCGHTHQNGYALDHRGIHYVVLAGVIETSPQETAFATVAIYRNHVEITGHGREVSRMLWLEDIRADKRRTHSLDMPEESTTFAPSVPVVV